MRAIAIDDRSFAIRLRCFGMIYDKTQRSMSRQELLECLLKRPVSLDESLHRPFDISGGIGQDREDPLAGISGELGSDS